MENLKLEMYKKDGEISYSFGAFRTFELINKKKEYVKYVLLHSKLKMTEDIQKLINICKKENIEIVQNDKVINKIVDKENCFVVGVFKKFEMRNKNGKHLVLVNPSDMGNMGTILRTALGFEYTNINIVKPCVDIFSP